MKTPIQNLPHLARLIALVLLSTLNLPLSTFAQGTGFTYQGRLNDGANPAGGIYDLRFAIYDAASGGTAQGTTLTNSATSVSNGLFTVTLDFGNFFPGANRWLEIGVRTNGGGGFTTLSPRQKLTATPYAVTAGNVTGPLAAGNLSGALPSASLSGTYGNAVILNNAANSFSGNGTGLTNVSAATLGGLSSANFWRTGGNAGTTPGPQFLGTTDNLPVEFKVNGTRALRLEPTVFPEIVNVVGGSPRNLVTNGAVGATIWGGGADELGDYGNTVAGTFGTVSGGRQNSANNAETTVAGGRANTASGLNSTVSGGYANTVSGAYGSIGGGIYNLLTNAYSATLGGGVENTIQTYATSATLGGGYQNTIQTGGQFATLGGGLQNTIHTNADYATIPGGRFNSATNYAFAAGNRAKANHTGAFVWADSLDVDFASTANDQFSVRANNGVAIQANTNGTALEIRTGGAIKVTGAGIGTGTPAFVHRATPANIEAFATHRTTITHPHCDGNPNAILIITHNYNPGLTGNVLDVNPTSVFYHPGLAKWQIYHDNFAAMAADNAWNVLVFKP